MQLDYSLYNFKIHENWFESNKINNKNGVILYSYKNTYMDINSLFFFKIKKFTILNDLTLSLENIFSSFKRVSRNCINKIDKNENFIFKYNSLSHDTFIQFYNNFAQKKSLPYMTKKRIEKYGNNIFYISGYLNNNLTNIHVYVFDDIQKIVRFLYSVSTIYDAKDSKEKNTIGCINRYLYWKAIQYFHDQDYITMDMGGYSNSNDNIMSGIDKYKETFGGEIVILYDYMSLPFYFLTKLKEYLK